MAGYDSVDSHRSMLFDERRNRAYGEAIAAVVNSDSVVLDLGCGLGIHGLLAARAGARKVYMVEPEPIIELTRRVVAANGFNNVELIQASAEELQLDEPVDLIISVFTGNFLLTEDLLPSLFTARDNCLRSGGVLLPGRARMRVAPVSCSAYFDAVVARWGPASAAQSWSAAGFDYAVARTYAANTTYYDSAKNFEATLLAAAATLLDLDFYAASRAEVDAEVTFEVEEDGVCHGWLGWFDMQLGDNWLSTSPQEPALHWGQMYMPVPQPVPVSAGQQLRFSLQRALRGEWNWRSGFAEQEFRASTFLRQPVDLGLLQRLAEASQPQLGGEGEIVQLVLNRMDGSHSNVAIAAELERRWPQRFERVTALELVQSLVRKYC